MADCSQISVCGRISVQVSCLSSIYQGEDVEIVFQFLDSNGDALDLTEYTNIIGVLYGELNTPIATYTYPSTTDTNELSVLQAGSSVIGQASIRIESVLTSGLIEGKLFIEFKLTEADTSYNNGTRVTIIPCLQVGNVRKSAINTFSELPSVTIPSVIGVTSVNGQAGAIFLDDEYVPKTGGTFTGDVTIDGKLNVTGLIDPTGLILNEQSSKPAVIGQGEGMIWVNNNRLYYTNSSDSTSLVVLAGDDISQLNNDLNYITGSQVPVDRVTIDYNTAGELEAIGGGGSGIPGGNTTEIQFNDSGSFNGDSSLYFDTNYNTLINTPIFPSGTGFIGAGSNGIGSVGMLSQYLDGAKKAFSMSGDLTGLGLEDVSFAAGYSDGGDNYRRLELTSTYARLRVRDTNVAVNSDDNILLQEGLIQISQSSDTASALIQVESTQLLIANSLVTGEVNMIKFETTGIKFDFGANEYIFPNTVGSIGNSMILGSNNTLEWGNVPVDGVTIDYNTAGELEAIVNGGSSLWTQNANGIHNNSGFVGINQSFPTSLLHIKDSGVGNPLFSIDASDDTNIIKISGASTSGVVLGYNSTALGDSSIAIGPSNNSDTEDSIGIGRGIITTAISTIGIGSGLTFNGDAEEAISIGRNNDIQAVGAIVIGNVSQGTSDNCIVLGSEISVDAEYGIALGYDVSNSISGTLMVGFATGQQSFFVNSNANIVLRGQQNLTSDIHFDATGSNILTIHNGTSPLNTIANAIQIRSVSGNIEIIEDDGTIQKIGTKTPAYTTTLEFDSDKLMSVTQSSDITFDLAATGNVAGYVIGIKVIGDSTNDVFFATGTNFKIIGGSFDNTTINYIYFHYVDFGSDEVLVTFNQEI